MKKIPFYDIQPTAGSPKSPTKLVVWIFWGQSTVPLLCSSLFKTREIQSRAAKSTKAAEEMVAMFGVFSTEMNFQFEGISVLNWKNVTRSKKQTILPDLQILSLDN